MLSRLVSRTSCCIRAFPVAVAPKPLPNPNHAPLPRFLLRRQRPFSSNEGNSGGGDVPPSNPWKILNDAETSSSLERIFADGGGAAAGGREGDGKVEEEDSWLKGDEGVGADDGAVKVEKGGASGDGDGWLTAEGYKAWTIGPDQEDVKDVFDIGENVGGGEGGIVGLEDEEARLKQREKEEEERKRFEAEEMRLTPALKGKFFSL